MCLIIDTLPNTKINIRGIVHVWHVGDYLWFNIYTI